MTLSRLPRIVFLLLLLLAHGAMPAWSATPAHWVTGWMAAPDASGPALPPQTIRQVVRSSAGGSRVRLRLSNLFGTAPLQIGAAHIAIRAGGADIRPGSSHALHFGGAASVTIAAGESALSDPVGMDVAALQELAVSIHLPAGAAASTLHGAGMQTAYIAPGPDSGAAAVFPASATDDSRYFLSDVEVEADGATRTLVVVGDSIADGIGSTQDDNRRWPDLLARRLRQSGTHPPPAVANAGIAGNRLLNGRAKPFVGPSTLERFERDALDKPGVRWIVLAQGINDILAGEMLADPAQRVSADDIIEGMRTLVARAHARGIMVWGATLTPLAGVGPPFRYSAEAQAKRQAVNAWIRGSGTFDAVLDADLALRDPARPERLLPRFDSGDHLHPNDAGYQAMAQAAAALWRERRIR